VSTINSFTASPATITNGQSSTLTWSADATNCGVFDDANSSVVIPAQQAPGSPSGASGSVSVSPATTWTYTIKCYKDYGNYAGVGPTVTRTVTVNVVEGSGPTISSLTATAVGGSPVKTINLSWTASATSCRLEQHTDQLGSTSNPFVAGVGQVVWTGSGSGSFQVSPKSSGVFVLICQQNRKMAVRSLPVTVDFTDNTNANTYYVKSMVNPSSLTTTADAKINGSNGTGGFVEVKKGVPITYSWSSSNAQSCITSDPGISGIAGSGSNNWDGKNLYTKPVSGVPHLDSENTFVFTVTCKGYVGQFLQGQYDYTSASDTVTVRMIP
jgi:VCBS repeat-containing protein